METTKRLLDYWYNLEYFSPYYPVTNKDTTYISTLRKKIIWLEKQDNRYTYDVYLGDTICKDLIKQMLKDLNEDVNDIEEDNAKSCICAFKVSSDGRYVENSFVVSTFVWGISKMKVDNKINAMFDTIDLNQFDGNMNSLLLAVDGVLDYLKLEELLLAVVEKLQLDNGLIRFNAIINKKFSKRITKKDSKKEQNKEEKNTIDNTTEMLSSFYVNDIDLIRKKVTESDSIVKYIEALKTSHKYRKEIDIDVELMKLWTSPSKLPLGKWPSKYSPSLMQQIAINMSISDENELDKIFSVNGPPGTGKTTLLKEVIASYIVDRALILAEYIKPDEAFKQCTFQDSKNIYTQNYYKPVREIQKYGIIVASNNNSAVENISKELPLNIDECHTNLFNINTTNEIYFSNIAQSLVGKDKACWGLISTRLGKKANINEFKKALWFDESNNTLKEAYKKELPDWNKAVKIFKNKYSQVIEYRSKITKAASHLDEHKKISVAYNEIIVERDKSLLNLSLKEKEARKQRNKQKELEHKVNVFEDDYIMLKNRLPFYKKFLSFLFTNDLIIKQMKNIKDETDKLVLELSDTKMLIMNLDSEVHILKENQERIDKRFNEVKEIFRKSTIQLNNYKQQFENNYPDESFWKDIAGNEKSQLACPWTNEEYDTLREELFYDALMLQKAFILNSKAVKQNIICLINMWSNEFSERDKISAYAHLLNTLFIVVPVLSTTFASVSTFLKHIDKNELGTVIIDEAGQATPQSSIGAIWRTKKAIIVGDPLQVEPIMTVPNELIKRFSEKFSIENVYKSQEISVQMLADNINPFGGYRDYLDGKMWLGSPLVVHRRCLDPMFSISNKIAYNNRMFKMSKEPDKNIKLSFSKSLWIDISGNANSGKDHFVQNQGDKALELVLNAFELQQDFPNLYIISPFKSVAYGMKNVLRKALYKKYPKKKEVCDNWINKSCGTIHTFQGKEANEVILLLGCDREKGVGAAQWAGKKPNILNVAVSRAKYRIIIIGDRKLWTKVPYFDYAYSILKSS